MADFDPQQPAENEAANKPQSQDEQSTSPRWDEGRGCGSGRDQCGSSDYRSESYRSDFVADWSGAERSLAEQAESFEARKAEMEQPKQPERFWLDLVKSQQTTDAQAAEAAPRQSEGLWSDLVSSQFSPPAEPREAAPEYLTSKPTGMGWADEEASEWAPPEREADYTRATEPVEAAAEGFEPETTALARRDDVEWSEPASAQDEFASTRSEALSADEHPRTLMDAAVEAAQAAPKKGRATRKTAAKKPAKAKKTVARKPAKKTAAKKPAAKKAARKTPAPKIVKAPPTRRAA
jgi:hypothetical protein